MGIGPANSVGAVAIPRRMPVGGPPGYTSAVADVLHVNDVRSGGGAEVLIERLMHMQRERGMDVRLFTAEDVPGFRQTAAGYIDSLTCRRAFRTALRTHRPRIVHLHNFYHALTPGILAELARARRDAAGGPQRIVMTAHDLHLVCPNAGLRWFHRRGWAHGDAMRTRQWSYLLTRRWDHRGWAYSTLKLAQHVWNYRLRDRRRVLDAVMAPSRFAQQALTWHGMSAVVVPNPAPRVARVAPDRPREPLRLIFVGRVEPEKGVAELLRWLPVPFDGVLTIVGDGTALAECRSIVSNRGLGEAVQFAGYQPRERVMEMIAASHVLVLPSLVYESAGLVLLEALSVGTNILATAHGGQGEIVADAGVGYTFETGNRASFDAALSAIRSGHESGELNSFTVDEFLTSRSERCYVDRVRAMYDADAAISEDSAAAAGTAPAARESEGAV